MKREGEVRIPSGCAIAAVIDRDGGRIPGNLTAEAMRPMHERSNGLGGGFAGYGIYHEYRDFYALHFFFDDRAARKDCEVYLKERFEIVKSEIIPTRKIPAVTDEPVIWRYFVDPLKSVLAAEQVDEREFVVRTVMKINTERRGGYVFSSGKNCFKHSSSSLASIGLAKKPWKPYSQYCSFIPLMALAVRAMTTVY